MVAFGPRSRGRGFRDRELRRVFPSDDRLFQLARWLVAWQPLPAPSSLPRGPGSAPCTGVSVVAVGVPRGDRLLRRDPLPLDRVVASFPAGLLLAGRCRIGVVPPERLGGPQSLLPFVGSFSSSAGGGDDRRGRRGRAVLPRPLPAVGGRRPDRTPARVLDSLDRPGARVWSASL